MPSFKEKFEVVKAALSNMESRVLISEARLRELLTRITELEEEVFGKQGQPSDIDLQVVQINTQLDEIQKLLGIDTSLKLTSSENSTESTFSEMSRTLHVITRHLRESSVRASTLLNGLVGRPASKLLNRGRREAIRKQSITSLASSLAQSPPRILSPPRIPEKGHSRSASSSTNK